MVGLAGWPRLRSIGQYTLVCMQCPRAHRGGRGSERSHMTFDALTMHAVRDELEREILGGHVDAVVPIDDRRVGLEVFARGGRRTLVLSLRPTDSRIYLTGERVRRGTERVTPFLLLLRKYVRGGRVAAIAQPRLERVLTLHIASHPDGGLPREVDLIAEAMGRRSNLLLVDEDGTVMDALVRVPPSVSPRRPLLPHLRYTLPPRSLKVDPADPTLDAVLEEAARDAAGPAWRLVVATVDGLSPLAAQEALARTTGTSEIAVSAVDHWDDVVCALGEIVAPLGTGFWEPCIAWRDDTPVAFAPYQLRQFPDLEIRRYATMSEVVETAVQEAVRSAPFDRLRRPLLDAISARIRQAHRKRSSLDHSLHAAEEADTLRQAGESILANVYSLTPGATWLEVEGRRIELSPTRSPVENAQAYFRQYTSARDARRIVPPLQVAVEGELHFLEEMTLHVEMAENEIEIRTLRSELENLGVVHSLRSASHATRRGRTPPAPARKGQPALGAYRRVALPGAEILVGASALGNDTVTFRLGRPDDLWFHARGVPGAHVILRGVGGAANLSHIDRAARLAARFSAARHATQVEVDYTACKHVRKVAGAAAGRVTYRKESSLRVRPAESDAAL
ncbi:MAG: DUF814 domain-containing protein [Chloroflexi bacterium]|nr:DUF814 domain-containing protein [Chloroflexota bacterium]